MGDKQKAIIRTSRLFTAYDRRFPDEEEDGYQKILSKLAEIEANPLLAETLAKNLRKCLIGDNLDPPMHDDPSNPWTSWKDKDGKDPIMKFIEATPKIPGNTSAWAD